MEGGVDVWEEEGRVRGIGNRRAGQGERRKEGGAGV